MSRAQTMRGSLGKATAVATSTIGLIAGADSRKASAADGRTPRCISRLAIGTEPHSQPGSAMPQTPASGTASAALLGITLVKKLAGTKAAIAPETSTPSTRNGVAWTQIATNTVAQPGRRMALSSAASWLRKQHSGQQDQPEDLQRSRTVATSVADRGGAATSCLRSVIGYSPIPDSAATTPLGSAPTAPPNRRCRDAKISQACHR